MRSHRLRKAVWRFVCVAIAITTFFPAAAQESVWNHPWTCTQFLRAYDESPPVSTAEGILGRLYPFSAYIFVVWDNFNEEAAKHRLPIILPVRGAGLQYLARVAAICRQDTARGLKTATFMVYQEDRSLNGLPLLRGCRLNQPGISCEMGH
jgi:hypothetical protein